MKLYIEEVNQDGVNYRYLRGGVVDINFSFSQIGKFLDNKIGKMPLRELEELDKMIEKGDIDLYDIDNYVDDLLSYLEEDLYLSNRYGTDEARLHLAMLLECFSLEDYDERKQAIIYNTPFSSSITGYCQIICCMLEEKGFISDSKYCQLTEKGKIGRAHV